MNGRGIAIALGVVVAVIGVFVAIALIAKPSEQERQNANSIENYGPPRIPTVFLAAYKNAETLNAAANPGCTGLSWHLLAGIGAVESSQGAGKTIGENGEVTPKVIGPRLDGSGVGGNVTPFYDTDGGELDGDTEYDRAVGPLQFLPETWTSWAQDGNGDGVTDPHNIYDAALTAAAYLCGNDEADLTDPATLDAAIYRYNRSSDYAADVRAYSSAYADAG